MTPQINPFLAAQAAAAAIVPCRYCGAKADQPCVNRSLDGHPPTRTPHPNRVADARRKRLGGGPTTTTGSTRP